MELNFGNIIFVGIICWNVYSSVKLLAKAINGAILRHEATHSNEIYIKGSYSGYKVSNYLFVYGVEIALLVMFFTLVFRYKLVAWFKASIWLCIVTTIMAIAVQCVALFKEKDVYLTNKGLVYFLGIFDFDKNKFVWEQGANPEQVSGTLHIYKPKDNFPYTVNFEQQIETAHRIVDKNYKK